MFQKLPSDKKIKLVIALGIALLLVFEWFCLEFKNWRLENHDLVYARHKEEALEEEGLASPILEKKELNSSSVIFSWMSIKYADKYVILKYNSSKKKYETYKEIEAEIITEEVFQPEKKIEVETGNMPGKYKVRAIAKIKGKKYTSLSNVIKIKSNVSEAKSYKSITTIKTLSHDDVDVVAVANGKNGATHAQSMCIAGNNYVVALVNRGNSKGYLEMFDRNGRRVKGKETGKIGHANGCTYNPNNGNIYVMTTYAGHRNKSIKVFDGKSLQAKDDVTLSVAPSGIGFDASNNKYYFTASSRMYVMDNKMNRTATHLRKRKYHSQDVAGYNGVIMSCIWTSGKGSYIDMYREADGAYIGSIHAPFGEIESCCMDDGYLVMLFNGGKIYRTKERCALY